MTTQLPARATTRDRAARLLLAAVTAGGFVLAACVPDRIAGPGAAAPLYPAAGIPAAHGASILVTCTGDARTGAFRCGDPAATTTAGAPRLVIGGQGIHVRLASPPGSLSIDTQHDCTGQPAPTRTCWTFPVTVTNLMTQALALTPSGYDPDGIRVFFAGDVTTRTDLLAPGIGTVANPSGYRIGSASQQPYYQYSGEIVLGFDDVLTHGETTGGNVPWTIETDIDATSFSFQVYVQGDVRYREGLIALANGAPIEPYGYVNVLSHSTMQLSGTPQSVAGDVLSPAELTGSVQWSSGDVGIATVDNTGLVTAVSDGDALITASITRTNGTTLYGYVNVTVRAGPPVSMQVSAGDGQTVAAGRQVPITPAVLVVDSVGNPVPNVTVFFAPAGGSGSVPSPFATTDASGVATVDGWTLDSHPGTDTLRASSIGLPDVTFLATVVAGPAFNIAVVTGDGQSAPAGRQVQSRIGVQVTDSYGNHAGGDTVTFTVIGGAGTVMDGVQVTDTTGTAFLTIWNLDTIARTNTLKVTSGNATPAQVFATGTVGAPDHFTFSPIGSPITGAPFDVTISIVDLFGNVNVGLNGNGEVTLDHGTFTTGGGPVMFSGGQVTQHLQVDAIGIYHLDVSFSGGALIGASDNFEVGAPDAGCSRIPSTPAPAPRTVNAGRAPAAVRAEGTRPLRAP